MLNEVKAHVGRHKVAYSVGTVVIAGITFAIVRGRYVMVGNAALNGSDGITVRPLSFFSNKQMVNVVSVVEREGRGHPGYMVRCLETGVRYVTQEDAAKAIGADPTIMSRHINGIFDNAKGLHFERIAA